MNLYPFWSPTQLGCLRFLFMLSWLMMVGCQWLSGPDLPDDSYRLACGQQCLKNGEQCSQFFGVRNEETRINFEQSKANYWLCKKRFSESTNKGEDICIPPGPPSQTFDHCGKDLEECLAGCPITLDELRGLPAKVSVKPPLEMSGGFNGTISPDVKSQNY